MTRAVATSNWSAGSRWKGCGSWVDSTTIRGSRCTSVTPGSARALSIQSPTVRSSFSLPYSTSFATSQQEMTLTPKMRSVPSSRSPRCLGCSRSGRETYQIQMWVSSRITARRPNPRLRRVPSGHGIQGPSPVDRGPRWSSPLRFSKSPTLQPAHQARKASPLNGVRPAPRLPRLSNAPARP